MDLPYYHGCLTKRACEALLLKGGADGNFLIRDSESVPGALCLCVSYKKLVYSYRIFREKHGYYRIQTEADVPRKIFPNLEELVSKYKKPDQGLVVHLSNPIMRTDLCQKGRRSELELNIYENTNEEYVDVLPWRQGYWTRQATKETALLSADTSSSVNLKHQFLVDHCDPLIRIARSVLQPWRSHFPDARLLAQSSRGPKATTYWPLTPLSWNWTAITQSPVWLEAAGLLHGWQLSTGQREVKFHTASRKSTQQDVRAPILWLWL